MAIEIPDLVQLTDEIVGRERARLDKLEHDMAILQKHCDELRAGQSTVVPVETFAPEPFLLTRHFQAVVRPCGGDYLAMFFDANIGTMGDTEEEAVQNLKALIIDTFECLESNEENLGPEPTRQLAILKALIRKQK
jgi:predicted RNase H-like HicB family nuclease